MFDNHPPGHDHQTPTNLRAVNSRRRWLLAALTALAVVVGISLVAVLLVLPPLLQPPPTPGPPYDLFQFGEVSREINPDEDHLLELNDGQISLYIPAGAYPDGGIMVLQPRGDDLIPMRVDGALERIQAVDVLLLSEVGEVVSSPRFESELLICFRLPDPVQELQQSDVAAVMIERFDEDPEVLEWVQLDAGPGWDPNQICSPLGHLSILALTVRHPVPTATPGPTPKAGPTSTPLPPDIYSFPEGDS